MAYVSCDAAILAFVLCLLITSCAEMSGSQKGALGGAAVGSGMGAIIRHGTGHTGEGIAIGAGVGGLSGALIGHESDNSDTRDAAQEERMRRLEEENRRQRRELEELKRGTYDNY